MIKNYLVIALRNLTKHRLFSVIHILGLTMAFGVSIMLFLAARFEFSFDDFHENKDRIFQVYFETQPQEGKLEDASLPVPFAPAAQQELKGIEHISRYGDNGGALIRLGDKEIGLTTRFVDPPFLRMFSFPLMEGSPVSALNELNGLVLTRRTANNLFGEAEARGQEVELNIEGTWAPFTVTGIMEDFPDNSSLRFDAFVRFEKFPGYRGNTDEWNSRNHGAFIQLADNINVSDFEGDSQSFVEKYFKTDEPGGYKYLKLLPLAKMHFSSFGMGGLSTNMMFPWMLMMISALVLFIACTNFMNLSLASSFLRGKEIAMRKTLGASKLQLILQFWTEALLICLVSLLFGGLLAWMLLPTFNSVLGYSLSIQHVFTPEHLTLLTLLFFILTAIAGGYPSFIMAGFNTIQILKGKLRIGSKNGLRSALSVGQFSIAIFLIIATLTVIQQIDFIRNKPLGYSQSEVISIPIGNNIDSETALGRMRTALGALPDVEAVTGTDINMGLGRDGARSRTGLGFNYEGRKIVTDWMRVDYDYLRTMQIELLQGRDFSRSFATDTAAVLVNEVMAKLLGKEDVVGLMLPVIDSQSVRVIGVIKNFNTQTLHEQIPPLTLYINPAEEAVQYLFVRVKNNNLAESLANVEKVWKSVNPKASIAPSFLNENTQRMYEKEKRFSLIIVSGAILAVIISCMGLFALAILLMNQRIKEIGVRKVLGAKVHSIVLLLSGDFIKLIGIAFVIAAPLAWWLMNDWLNGFAFRIDLNLLTLLVGGLMVLTVALITVVSQSLKAALMNPVKTLRTE